MKNNPIPHRRIVSALLLVSIVIANPVSAAFIISGESSCSGSDTYSYHFSKTAVSPNLSAKVSETALFPDITMN